MHRIQSFAVYVVAFSFATVGVGCQDDAAVKALEELTNNLSATAEEQNEQLTTLSSQIETCKGHLATVNKEHAIIKQADGTIDIPALSGDRNLAALDAHKLALNDTIDKQKARVRELEAESEKCTEELTHARRKAQHKKRKH